MAEQISFIHAADLHLDSPFQGLARTPAHIFEDIQASTFVALNHLVQAAIEKQVDFVLLTGDLFDNEKQSLKAQIRLRRAFEELERHKIHVYLSYGNHDYLNGNRHPVTYPDNVYIFTEEQVSHFTYEKNNKKIAQIYGFSYEERAVHTNKAREYDIEDEQIPYHIAMLHGSLHSNTEHDVYAPFYLSDLVGKDFDYWALGHIHQREILKENPYIVYPGNIQGRNRKEQGEKGCYHVILSQADTMISFVPLQAVQFHELVIDVSGCEEIHQIEAKIQTELKNWQPSVPQLIQLQMTSDSTQLKHWEAEGYVDEMIELVNETSVHGTRWIYIFRYTVAISKNPLIDDTLYKGEHFLGELMRHFDEVPVQPFMKELFQHKQARKYLDSLSVEEEQEIKTEAKEWLVNALLADRGE